MHKAISEVTWTPYRPHFFSRLPAPFKGLQLVMMRKTANGWQYRKPTEWETIEHLESRRHS